MLEQPIARSFLQAYDFNEALEILKSCGRSTHSFLTIYPDVQQFRVDGVSGYIPIVCSKELILICAEPVCESSAAFALLSELKSYALSKSCSIAALPASENARSLFESSGFSSLYIGKEPIFELARLPNLGKSIRQAAERARRKGLEVVPFDECYRMQMELLCRGWQDKGELPPMDFLFQLRPLELKAYKKYFLVVDENRVLKAFLACSPIYARNGWYLEDLIRDPKAPNGCTELLVTETLKSLAAEGFEIASLALAPLAGLPDRDENHPLLNQILRLSYKHLSFIYHFETLEYFKAKFHPSHWESNYLCYWTKEPMLVLVKNVLCSFLPKQRLPDIIKHKIEQWRIVRK